MKTVKMRTTNLQESFAQFKDTKQFNRIRDKYTEKAYEQKNLVKFYLCKFLSVLCGVGSVFFAYVYATDQTNELINYYPIAVFLSVFLLVLFEVLQRWALGSLLLNYFTNGLKIKDLGNILLAVSITVISVFLSYKGSFRQVEKWNGTPPQYIAPTLSSVSDLKQEFNTMISKAEKKAKNYKDENMVTWKGKKVLNWIAREPYAKMLVSIDLLETKKLQAIEKLELKNEKLISEAKKNHTSTLFDFKQKNESKGANLGYITLVLQLVMFICLGFTEYYDYRVQDQYKEALLFDEKEQQKSQRNFDLPQRYSNAGASLNLPQRNELQSVAVETPQRILVDLPQRTATDFKNIATESVIFQKQKALKNRRSFKSKITTNKGDINKAIAGFEKWNLEVIRLGGKAEKLPKIQAKETGLRVV